ncbi:MAG: peroxidase-related enzyme [Pseudomonadales bacterium]|nr:peroxidase-related enzyme [Pseudomonadales bacterium]
MSDISSYPIPVLSELPDDVRERIEQIGEKSGFIPNVFLAFAYRPGEFRAFFDYYDALMTRDSGLSKAEKEMIVVATSGANDCSYCVIAHGALLRVFAKDAKISDKILANYRSADLSERQREMLRVALILARTPEQVGQNEYDALFAQGFSQDDIWDIGAITALFALSNRMAHWANMRPNDEFYGMAR